MTAERPILIVDDDPSILDTVTEILAFEGYTVARARNGQEALRYIEQTLPALMLLDMRMPVLDGWGLSRQLREQGIVLPIIVMTAAQDAHRWAQEIAAAGYLAKPFDLTELLTVVDRLLLRG